MNVEKVDFIKFKSMVSEKEGIVCLGAGGNPEEWVNGITDLLNKENIVTGAPEQIWDNIYVLTSTGGRTDLAFVSNTCLQNFNVGKMAMWRLSFGDCSWISDYVVNYANHF